MSDYNFAYLDETDQAHDPPRDPERGRGAGLPGAVCQPRDARCPMAGAPAACR